MENKKNVNAEKQNQKQKKEGKQAPKPWVTFGDYLMQTPGFSTLFDKLKKPRFYKKASKKEK
jgi:hypothetical protein